MLDDFASCDVADALVQLGHKNCFIPKTRQITGDARRIHGQALTVQMEHASSPTKSSLPPGHYLDTFPTLLTPEQAQNNNLIVCISSPEDCPSACWGGLMTARALQHRTKHLAPMATLLVNGARVRDTREVSDFKWNVYAQGTSSLGGRGITKAVSVNQPISIPCTNFVSEFQNAVIRPGDYIIMDEDGVVICPLELVEQVQALCEKQTHVDEKCMADLMRGHTITETFAKHR